MLTEAFDKLFCVGRVKVYLVILVLCCFSYVLICLSKSMSESSDLFLKSAANSGGSAMGVGIAGRVLSFLLGNYNTILSPGISCGADFSLSNIGCVAAKTMSYLR